MDPNQNTEKEKNQIIGIKEKIFQITSFSSSTPLVGEYVTTDEPVSPFPVKTTPDLVTVINNESENRARSRQVF